MGIEYGPNGDVAVVRRGSKEWSYIYDESGQRVLKLRAGAPVTGFIGEVVLTERAFIQPVRIAGHLVGVLENGRFRMVLTDPRGTVLRSDESQDEPASPYGARSSRGALSVAFDYAGKGYDPELGTIRMGVRDYDPQIAQFWVADPLMLESMDACVGRPIECSLYSYAGNDPLLYVDPSGQSFTAVDLIRWRDAYAHGAIVGIAKIGGAVDVVVNTVIGRGEQALERYQATLAQLEACGRDSGYDQEALAQGEAFAMMVSFPPIGGTSPSAPGVEVVWAKKPPIPTPKIAPEPIPPTAAQRVAAKGLKGARLEPADLREQLTLEEARGGAGEVYSGKLGDLKYNAQTGTQTKMQHNHAHGDGTSTEVHYDVDRATGEGSGFKIKDDTNAASRGNLYPNLEQN